MAEPVKAALALAAIAARDGDILTTRAALLCGFCVRTAIRSGGEPGIEVGVVGVIVEIAVEGVGDALRVRPSRAAVVPVGERPMEVEGQVPEGRDRGRKPVLRDEPGSLAGRGCKELGGGVDEVYSVVWGRELGKGVGGREADDACAEDDCGGHARV